MLSPKSQPVDRRAFISGAVATGAAAGAFALFASGASAAPAPQLSAALPLRTGASSAGQEFMHVSQSVRSTTATTFGALKQIDAGELSIGYAEAGPADGPPVILLHGWPYDIHSFVDVAPLLAAAGYRVVVPYLRGHGMTRFLSSATFRNAQQSVVALDIVALMDALAIERAIIAGYD